MLESSTCCSLSSTMASPAGPRLATGRGLLLAAEATCGLHSDPSFPPSSASLLDTESPKLPLTKVLHSRPFPANKS